MLPSICVSLVIGTVSFLMLNLPFYRCNLDITYNCWTLSPSTDHSIMSTSFFLQLVIMLSYLQDISCALPTLLSMSYTMPSFATSPSSNPLPPLPPHHWPIFFTQKMSSINNKKQNHLHLPVTKKKPLSLFYFITCNYKTHVIIHQIHVPSFDQISAHSINWLTLIDPSVLTGFADCPNLLSSPLDNRKIVHNISAHSVNKGSAGKVQPY